jgi:hypothetical protein
MEDHPMKEKVLESILSRRRLAARQTKKGAALAKKTTAESEERDEEIERLKHLAQTASVTGAAVNKGG